MAVRSKDEDDYCKLLKQQQPSKKLSTMKLSASMGSIIVVKKPMSLMLPKLNEGQIDLASSLTSGFLTGILTNPMDVVTARLMTQPADFAKDLLPGFRSSVNAPYKGLFDCMTRMMREEGPRSFMIGVRARVSWIAPFVCISLGLNNMFKRSLKEWKTRQVGQPLLFERQSAKEKSKRNKVPAMKVLTVLRRRGK